MALREPCCFLFVLLLAVAKGCDSQSVSSGDLQLVSGYNRSEGRLNIFRNEKWGNVCYQDVKKGEADFTNASAGVACFQLGFAGAQAWFESDSGSRDEPTWMKTVNCTGIETRLDQCPLEWCSGKECSDCHDFDYDVGISCTDHWQVKLMHNSVISYQGTVHHYYNNTWGILCDEGWNLQSATVVCYQLGLGKAINNSSTFYHGSAMENFLVTNTNCTGQEHFLKDCPNNLWKIVQNCSGQHVAQIECEGPTLNIAAVSSTSTSISLKWAAAVDRYNYYPASEWYSVVYVKDDIGYLLLTDDKGITVPGLKPDTEYTFFVEADIVNDSIVGPPGNVTYRTNPPAVLHPGSEAAIGLGGFILFMTIIFIVTGVVLAARWYKRWRQQQRQPPEGPQPGGPAVNNLAQPPGNNERRPLIERDAQQPRMQRCIVQ